MSSYLPQVPDERLDTRWIDGGMDDFVPRRLA
jgi:hypothetical protein